MVTISCAGQVQRPRQANAGSVIKMHTPSFRRANRLLRPVLTMLVPLTPTTRDQRCTLKLDGDDGLCAYGHQ